MNFNFRKVASVLASAAMLSSTIGFAAAAAYPAPFVVSGNADGSVVVGANAAATDWAAAVDISSDLSKRATSTTGGATVVGNARSLSSGSDLVYLNDDLSENIQTITDTYLKNALADGTFTDDAGTDYDYEHTVGVGTSTANGLAFSDSGNDLDDPTMILALTDSTSTPVFTLNISFDSALNFSASDSEGEEITLFGKTYTIGTATTTAGVIVLQGGAAETTVNVGESTTVNVGGESYEVSLNAISDATTAQASITVNGDTKQFAQGNNKKIAGLDVFAKTVFRSADNQGYVIIQLGADKLTIEDTKSAKEGSDNEDIDKTLVSITGGSTATTKIGISVAASDNDLDHLLVGESFVDPVFGAISLDFVGLKNAPEFTDSDKPHVDKSTTRKHVAIVKEGNRELGVQLEVPGSKMETIPLAYQTNAQDGNGKTIHVIEGVSMNEDEYFTINTGDFTRFLKITDISLGNTSSDVTFVDQINRNAAGAKDTFKIDNDANLNQSYKSTTTIDIDGTTYTVRPGRNRTSIRVYSSDFTGNFGGAADSLVNFTGVVSVYPYLNLVDGKDVRFAIVDEVEIGNLVHGATLRTPTGDIAVTLNGTNDTTVGRVAYIIDTQLITNNRQNVTIGVVNASITNLTGSTVSRSTDPGVLIWEEADKTETTTTTQNAVFLPTSDTGTYSNADAPKFSGAFDTDTFDDADYTGYVTNYGTYVKRDTSDTNQAFTSLSIPSEQMYAEVFISEIGASITPGSSGTGGQVNVVKDSEVSSVSSMNLLVVGGSCVNSVAAKILESDSPLCGADWTSKTNAGSGKYIIKSMASPYNANKVAVLAAGYNAADTQNAVAKLKEGATTDSGTEQVYPIVSA